MSGKNILRLLICLALPLIVGSVSGYIIKDEITGWYASLIKPLFNPPNYLFGPVWTLLYILMGISLYQLLQLPATKARTVAVCLFGFQLFLNFWWSIIFFSFHRINFAMAEIALLWVFISAMIISFFKLKPIAGYIQIPYLLWVSFASALNLSILLLNQA